MNDTERVSSPVPPPFRESLPTFRAAIVGSRRRDCKDEVENLIRSLHALYSNKLTIVSGGCEGVDTWAEDYAKAQSIKTDIYFPDLTNTLNKIDMIRRYYARNKLIVQNSDVVYAFVADNRKGGTENTIEWANRLHRHVVIK